MQNILIVGAASAIAEATARLYAAQGANLFLLARDEGRMSNIAADLVIRGASSVRSAHFDANDIDSHHKILDDALKALGTFDIVLIAHGTLGDQKACERDATAALQELQTNAMSTISLLTLLANIVEQQKHGTLAIISSVAGDRGRQSNYVYGTSKAALTTFCEGLRSRLHKQGIQVLTIKPGMVETPMTEGIDAPKILMAKPEQIASDIVTAIEKKKDVLYTPWFWKYVMVGIIHMPESIFKRIAI